MQAQEVVLDRIEQSFELFKNNFKVLFFPIFLYSFISTVFSVFITYLGVKKIQSLLESKDLTTMHFYDVLYSPESMIIIVIGIILLILYLILYIPFLLGLIKSISQIYSGDTVDYKVNLRYGFNNLGNSFKTYWYIFAYVALIPAIGFIIGGILLVSGMHFNQDIFIKVGSLTMGLSVILFIMFSIYRGLKSTFGLQSAVDTNNYTPENFKQSVNITQNKVWRILGNFLLVGLIGGLVIGMIQGVIDSFGSSFSIGADAISQSLFSKGEPSIEDLQGIMTDILGAYSPVANIITNTLQGAITTAFSIFMVVFTYLFLKRLEIESLEKNTQTTKIKI